MRYLVVVKEDLVRNQVVIGNCFFFRSSKRAFAAIPKAGIYQLRNCSIYFFASLEKVKQKDLRQRSDTVALGTSLTRHAHDAENNKTRLPPVGSNTYCFLRLLSATGTPTWYSYAPHPSTSNHLVSTIILISYLCNIKRLRPVLRLGHFPASGRSVPIALLIGVNRRSVSRRRRLKMS